jgi:uncharacterized delta-60 repeat protein
MFLRSSLLRMVNSRLNHSRGLRRSTSRQRPSAPPCTFERLEERTVLSTGIALTSISGYQDAGLASFLDANQKVVVAGFFSPASNSQNPDSALVRFTTSGALDGTFGVGGAATQPMSTTQADQANAVVPLPDGKILVAGKVMARHQGKTAWDFAVARYNANGTLDTTFGVGGVASVDFLAGEDVANALLVQPDGKIVAAGGARDSASTQHVALARFTSSGQLDSSFGSGGIVRIPLAGTIASSAAAVTMHQGKILAVGYAYSSSSNEDFALVRYDLNGSLDGTFGNGGVVISHFGSHQEFAEDVAIDTEGRILAVGMLFGLSGLGAGDFAVARYLPNGTLDTSFGTGGLARTEQGKDADAFAIALQGDGKIVLGGQVWSPVTADYAYSLIRYNVNGSLDDGSGSDTIPGDSFGTGGKVVTPILGNAKVQSLAIQPDGKIVAAGWAAFAGGVFAPSDHCAIAVARYNPDGSLDPAFGATAPSVWINDGAYPYYVNEGNSGTTAYDLTVRLSSVSSVDVSVQYATANGTATAGSDYQAKTGTLTIHAGAMSATITVLVNGDKTKEADETFYVNLSNPTGATIGHGQGMGTIRNDDAKTSSTSTTAATTDYAATTVTGTSPSTQASVGQASVDAAATTESTLVFNAASQTTGTAELSTGRATKNSQAIELALQDLESDLVADQIATALVP